MRNGTVWRLSWFWRSSGIVALGRVCLDFAMLTERPPGRKVPLLVRRGSKPGGSPEGLRQRAVARN